jgi:hypothetical protein
LKQNPPPGAYEVRKFITKEEEKQLQLKRRQNIDRNNLPKRPMFMDEMVNRFKGMPAPGQYTPKRLQTAKGSVQMLMDRVNYLDEAIINN